MIAFMVVLFAYTSTIIFCWIIPRKSHIQGNNVVGFDIFIMCIPIVNIICTLLFHFKPDSKWKDRFFMLK